MGGRYSSPMRSPYRSPAPAVHGAARPAGILKLLGRRAWQVVSRGPRFQRRTPQRHRLAGHRQPAIFALIRRSLTKPTEAACFYCHVPQHRPATLGVLVAVAGRRWTVEEDHEFSKDQFGFDQSQTRLFTPIMRHIVLVIAALAGHYVRWSWWRRRHQARARWYHHRADSHDHGRSPAAVAGPIS